MKFCFATLGCKVNQFETQALAQLAQQRGHVLAEKQADVCIINTCTVTSSGDHKTLRVLHKLQKENPNAIVALCGCFAQTGIRHGRRSHRLRHIRPRRRAGFVRAGGARPQSRLHSHGQPAAAGV